MRVRRLEQEMATPGGVAIAEFARRHAYGVRSVYRDLQALERSGVPVFESDGRYFIERRASQRPSASAQLTKAETASVRALRQLALPLKELRVGRALARAHGKLENDLGLLGGRASNDGATHAQAAASHDVPWAVSLRHASAIDYARHHRMTESLEAAIAQRVCVRLQYRALSEAGDQVTERIVEPARLHYDGDLGSLYLRARA